METPPRTGVKNIKKSLRRPPAGDIDGRRKEDQSKKEKKEMTRRRCLQRLVGDLSVRPPV